MNEDYGLERIEPTRIGRASEPVLLGEDEYFVLGDNVNNSEDSRYNNIGLITKSEVIGKVTKVIKPKSDKGKVK